MIRVIEPTRYDDAAFAMPSTWWASFDRSIKTLRADLLLTKRQLARRYIATGYIFETKAQHREARR